MSKLAYMNALKKIAKENDIDVPRGTSLDDLIDVLQTRNVDFPKEDEVIAEPSKKSGDLIQKLTDIKRAYELRRSVVDEDRVKREIAELDVKIRESGDMSLLESFFKWQKSRKVLDVKDTYHLNQLEQEHLEDVCTCHQKVPSSGLYAKLGGTYKYSQVFDEERQKQVYTTFVTRIVSPQAQITPQLKWKMDQGFMPEKGDYKKAKTLYHRVMLVETEWRKYFRHVG